MVQVRVAGVALDASGQHVLLLKPVDQIPGDGLVLPIWIGQLEATSILVAVENADVPRPLAHDLMGLILTALDAVATKVEVTRIEDGTFYAEITLSTALGDRIVDARPSDAVALASRVGAPIWVADAVLTEAGVPDVLTETDAAERLDEFKRFLDVVAPVDYESCAGLAPAFYLGRGSLLFGGVAAACGGATRTDPVVMLRRAP
jgi:bifunctional DNase/RNase